MARFFFDSQWVFSSLAGAHHVTLADDGRIAACSGLPF